MPLLPRADGGIVRGPLPEDTARTSILIAMLTLAIYMCVLVDLKVLQTFKRHNTLYFWALLVTSWGIMSHSLGIILKWFVGSCPWQVNTAFASFGWWGMVTGQSLVLYSRLHLVVRDQRTLRCVLIMIITNFTIFQVPTTIQTFGSNQQNPGAWLKVYNIYERIQLCVFTLQELLISTIYIRAAVRLLSPSDPTATHRTKKFLIYLNILCITLDIAFVCQVFSGEWVYKTGTQSLAYAIKLTLEFSVLNQLMDVYRLGPSACTVCRRRFDSRSRQINSAGGGGGGGGNTYDSGNRGVGIARPAMSRLVDSEQGLGGGGGATPLAWGRGGKLPRGAERLGPFEEEEEEMVGGASPPPSGGRGVQMKAAGLRSPVPAKEGIVVTTGITWSEERDGSGGGSGSKTGSLDS